MARRVVKLLACVFAALLISVQWQGHAQPVAPPAVAACEPASLAPTDPCLRELKARFVPPGPPPYPEDNPFTQAKYDLGRELFFEPLLSASGTHSCATCHNPALSWGDGRALALGDAGQPMPIRSPTLIDVAWLPVLGWDGKYPGIEEVTFAAISSKTNMALDVATAAARLAALPGYVAAFAEAFGGGAISREQIESALATYERSIVSGPAPFDLWVAGDEGAISDAAKRGFVVFNGQGNCAACHSGWSFTDGSFHDIGSATGDDLGRGALFPNSVQLRYAFKVTTLRDVARRAPYMHDGSITSLAAVIDLYDRGGIDRPSRSPEIKPLHLSNAQKGDLIAFLETLTSTPIPVAVPILPR